MNSTFDRLFAEGSTAVITGEHGTDEPPAGPGGRWGPSLCLRPCPRVGSALETLTAEALTLAGRHHWPTGREGVAHFTVRVMDHYRTDLTPAHPDARNVLEATRRVAARHRPVRLRLRGLILTRASVMACAEPVDGSADAFSADLAEELGPLGWYEDGFDRSIWYANLVHFTGPLSDPDGLVSWVAERRDVALGVTQARRVDLLDWEYDGRQMRPRVLGSADFAG